MLKGIPSILSPELLKVLMEMGHGDAIVIGDGNFPAASMGRRLIRLDVHGASAVLLIVVALEQDDLVSLLTRRASTMVSVSSTAGRLPVSPQVAQEVDAAVGEALANVERHAGENVHVWILIEDGDDAIAVSCATGRTSPSSPTASCCTGPSRQPRRWPR